MQRQKVPPDAKRNRALTFYEYQNGVNATDEKKKPLVSLLGLVGEIGDVQTVVKRRLEVGGYAHFSKDMAEEIGDTLWYLGSLASCFGLSLADIAAQNVAKAKALHSEGEINIFDKGFPKDERLPRQFSVVFVEKPLEGSVQVKIVVSGVIIGDALTDNALEDDGYRYHDAFHLAYAAILGWSPVTRTLLRRKRKSNKQTDEVEDGARAIIVEEAISVFLFNQAQTRDEFRALSSIDVSLLKTVIRLGGNLEVKRCTAKQWQLAIYKGYELFRQLRDNRGGTVSLDLDKTSISYTPPRKTRTVKRK